MPELDLAYVALAARDVQQVCRVLGDDLGLSQSAVDTADGKRHPAFAVGQSNLVIFSAGDAFLSTNHIGVDHIGLVADEPTGFAEQCGLTRVAGRNHGLNGLDQVCVANSETAGVHVRFTQALSNTAHSGDHIQRIDHVGIASANNAQAEHIFVNQIGCVYESRQTDMEMRQAFESFTSDKYGVVYHARQPEPVGGLRVSFVTVGDCELEFLQDYDAASGFEIKHGAPGNTKQDQSAIGRFIEKRDAGLHHIALKCHGINALLPRLAERGHRMIDLQGRPGSRRSQIGFMHPASFGGVLLHFVQRADL